MTYFVGVIQGIILKSVQVEALGDGDGDIWREHVS